ncbi:MAG: alpha-glucan family phosphorylase [Nitrospira sp. CR2.1]|nr:alpha-glucan family phosphorylase [Nitrospira sp. CR2.1]
MNSVKDPVCGMMLPLGERLSVVYQGQEFRFCSDLCKRTFLATPERYATGSAGVAHGAPDVARRIAYFSMEVAADSRMPTYSGGLGVLAGDTLRSCADLKIPIVAVSLLYTRGYFEQHLDQWGNQSEQPARWDPSKFARLLPPTVHVSIEGRPVVVRAWQYDITGLTGYVVPLLLLDSNVEENPAGDRELTSDLYGGDERYRLAQESILGIGGVRMLRTLGYTQAERFHMNEGHAALLALELLRERKQNEPAAWDFDGVRRACIFTTHTPVPAGHDQFSYELVKQLLGDAAPLEVLQMLAGRDRLNMTLLALNLSTYVNGVAKRHGQVSQDMFPGYAIDSITNGVHSTTWISPSFQQLFDRHIPGWRTDPFALRYAISIPAQDIWEAHVQAKARLLEEVRRRTSLPFRDEVLTIGFARRATQYKRSDLVLSAPDELVDIAKKVGPIQLIFAGKAHPKDEPGKEIIRRVVRVAGQVKPEVQIAYLEDYDLTLAQLLTAGVDLWLNTPLPPLEASGTSGMKAAHNGVPSLSVLDGWWVEGHIEGITGWSIGRGPSDATSQEGRGAQDARELYDKLRGVIAPMFYQRRERWSEIMRSTIAFNASFFNTHRMVQQYAANAYV